MLGCVGEVVGYVPEEGAGLCGGRHSLSDRKVGTVPNRSKFGTRMYQKLLVISSGEDLNG